MNLVVEDIGGAINYFMAEDPENIEKIFDKEEKSLSEKKNVAHDLAAQLSLLSKSQNYSIPHIKVVEESDLNEYLYKQYKIWAKSGELNDNIWWGFQDHSFTLNYKKFIEWSWRVGPKDLKVRFLTNEEEVEKEMQNKFSERRTMFWKDSLYDASLWIIGEYIIMVKSREKPHYLIEINDAVLARNMKEPFRGIWDRFSV